MGNYSQAGTDVRMQVRFFKGAGHSIHNSARAEFMRALKHVVDEASL